MRSIGVCVRSPGSGSWTLPVGIMVVLGISPWAFSRTILDLSGAWQYQKVGQLNYPPPNTWQSITVPGYLSGNHYERAWYRKTFTLPGSLAGSRIRLCFGGVKFDAKVWVNGLFVGGYLNGYEPFELDVTQAVVLKNRVQDANATAISFVDRQVTVNAGSTSQVDVTMPWSSPRLWSLLDPYLYHLETALEASGIQDIVKTRFGFREFWCEADRFYLNGTRINLLATSTWPPGSLLGRAQIQKVLADVKAGHNRAMRLHTQPWDETWYEVADEVGLMIVEEGAVWCDSYSYRLKDPVFWTNYGQHLTAAVRRDRNHPSIVMWSLEFIAIWPRRGPGRCRPRRTAHTE